MNETQPAESPIDACYTELGQKLAAAELMMATLALQLEHEQFDPAEWVDATRKISLYIERLRLARVALCPLLDPAPTLPSQVAGPAT